VKKPLKLQGFLPFRRNNRRNKLSRAENMLKEFHERFEIVVTPYLIETRRKLMAEEAQEYQDAEEEKDVVKIADALGDIVTVAYGTALCYGIDLDEVLEEIHRSNMTKDQPDIPGGKVKKGPGYVPPDIKKVMYGYRKDPHFNLSY
jgi:NTP pyrophosphatase (non-canonical NTP hydrolase)